MKPFKHILYSLLLLFTVFASAQTPFPTGIRLPNATEVVTADSIPVIDANNIIKKWISVDNLIASGGTIDQDNTNKIVTLYLGTNPNTESTIAAAINALPLFVITDKETPYFFSFSTYIQGIESV